MGVKSQKGAATVYTLIAMLVLTSVAVGFFVMSANRHQTQLETLEQIKDIYSQGYENTISEKYIGGDIVPIYTEAQLKKIGSNETVYIDGKNYIFATGKTYVLQNDVTFNETNESLFSTIQNMISNNTITVEGQGHIITVVGETTEFFIGNSNFQTSIKENNFQYTGNYQTYTVPTTGYYKIECWGAQGGTENNSDTGNEGAYVAGTIKLEENKNLYVYVGEKGRYNGLYNSILLGGYNGGGNSSDTSYVGEGRWTASGGGATDVRLVPGTWNDVSSLKSRMLVAAGGGGASGANMGSEQKCTAGAAGGLTGYNGGTTNVWGNYAINHEGKGANQTDPGAGGTNNNDYRGYFGLGGNGKSSGNDWIGGGGRRRLLWWPELEEIMQQLEEVAHHIFPDTQVA